MPWERDGSWRSGPAAAPLCSLAMQHGSQPCLAAHHSAFPREWELRGMCVGAAAGTVSSSALPKRQHVLCTMQKIHLASQSSGRLKLPFIFPVTRGGSPVYHSRSPVTQDKCRVILFVYSVITRAASLSHARRKVLFWCKPVMNKSRKLVKKWLVSIQTHRTERDKKKKTNHRRRTLFLHV